MTATPLTLQSETLRLEFDPTTGAVKRVTAENRAHHPYAVFRSRETSKAGLVICNYAEGSPVTVEARLASGEPLSRWRLVDGDGWQPLSRAITLPPCSAAVVL